MSQTNNLGQELYNAASDGKESEVERLLQKGVPPEWTDEYGNTPLFVAAYNGREGVVRQLIAAGANVNHKGNDQFTSLIYAAVKGHVACARRLLAAGADVNAANKSMNTARDIAKGYNNSNVLRALDEVQPSGLVRAAGEGYLMRVRHLLATGSDVNTPDSSGKTPLLAAVSKGHIALVELLLNAGAHPAQTTTDGGLLVIARRSKHDAVAALLETTLTKALFTAAKAGNAAEVTSVLAQGISPDCVDEALMVALIEGVAIGDPTKVATVLADGISADCVLEDGRSLLHVATTLGTAAVVQSLIFANANVNLPDQRGETALHVAVRSSRKAIVQLLVNAGADCDMVNEDSELVTAVISRDVNSLRGLLLRGGNPNATDKAGQTLLHLAVLGDAQDILTELLNTTGIDVSISNQLGDSPLVMAIKHGHRSFAKRMFAKVHKSPRHLDASELTVDFASRLGHGSFGAVYKGSWSGRTVAVKEGLRKDEANGLQKEIRALEACSSPYLLQLLGVTSAPHVQLVLEYMNGGDLREYLNKKHKGEPVAVNYSTLEVAWVIANALADLHHEDLLHRDLKSHNVLLSTTNYIKLADLGLARTDASTMTKGVGTLYWMAPEVQDPNAKYNAAADIYSFGVILTELDTLQLPYADIKMGPAKVMYEVIAGRLRPSLRTDCPTWLRELATACMAHDPKQRPTAHEIVKLLQRQLKEPMDATTTPPSAKPTPESTPLQSLQSSKTTSSGTQSFSALSTASLVAPTINCSSCKTPQSLLDSECSKCTAPAKSATLKLKVLHARLAKAKDRGVDISVPCFVCSAPTDATTDNCGECQFISSASDDERLRLLVAILENSSGTSTWTQLSTLVSTTVVCSVCKASHCVMDAECPTCATPALPASAKLDGLLHRIKASGAAIDTSCHCTVCESEAPITDVVCSDCEEPLPSDAEKDGNTPLCIAVYYANEGVVRQLIAAGANVHHKNNFKYTPLHYAAFRGHVASAHQLLTTGGDANAVDETLLHLAVLGNAKDVLTELLKAPGIDISKTNRALSRSMSKRLIHGELPLVTAIKHRHRHFAKQIFDIAREPMRSVAADEVIVEHANLLGQGCSGTVHKASWNGRPVAVKAGLQNEDIALEIKAMLECPSPYLLQLLAVTPSPNVHLVLEYMDGGDLRQYLDKKRDNIAVSVEYSTLEVAWVLANALADLHHAGLLHRDLKSKNVLLSSTNYIKVADFGLTRSDASSMTNGVGTFFWMAPEVQLRGAKYDKSADIYSFGVILTELDTLQTPYAEVQAIPWRVMAEVAAGRLRPSLRADCPQWLREIATACMAHDPEQRPSAHDIVKQLQRLRLGQSTAPHVALVINCVSCRTPQSVLGTVCSACKTRAKTAAVKLKVLRARLATAKKRGAGIDASMICFVCSASNDVMTDVCGECKHPSVASDDDQLRYLVAVLEHAHAKGRPTDGPARGSANAEEPATWIRLPSLAGTTVLCPVCKTRQPLTDMTCPTCATPTLAAPAKLAGLIRRIATSGAAIDTSIRCNFCGLKASVTDAECPTYFGLENIVRQLMAAGANVHHKNDNQWTPLHFAALNGHVESARHLIAAGADINAVTRYKSTPAHLASEWGYDAMVRLLLEAGADTRLTNTVRTSFRPLASHECCGKEKAPETSPRKKLHQRTPCLGRSTRTSCRIRRHLARARPARSLLHVATALGITEVMESLISADANAGQTLLHLAVLGDAQDILTELLQTAGINISQPNQLGDSPHVMAIKRGHRSFAKRIYSAVYEPTRNVAASELTVDAASRLGQGGFGAVYKGEWGGRPVAVKIGLRMDEVDGLQKEMRALQTYVAMRIRVLRCTSPYLLQLLGVTTAPQVQLVLELMDGGDLRGYLDKKKRGEAVPVEYSTLEGLLHCNLKSHNILLSSTSYIKVADLGLVRSDASRMTTGVGTVSWIAPEVQVPGAKYDAAADIYSFGVILTELNTLKLPYEDTKMAPWTLMAEVAAGRLRPGLRDDCPPWLRDLATACMAHDPMQRPTALQIARLLQRQRQHQPGDSLQPQPALPPAGATPAKAPIGSRQCSNTSPVVSSQSSTQSYSALSTASLVAPTINCSSCKAPQSLLNAVCSNCKAPAKAATLKLKVLHARLSKAKDRGVNICVPCFVCSAPTDATTDACGECQYISTASDDERLRLLVAILERAGSTAWTSTWTQLSTLVSTTVVCPVCKESHCVTDAECPTCAGPALPASAKLDGLLHRIKASGAAIDTSCHCTVCESEAQITDIVCSDCEEPLPSDAEKVYNLCRRIELFAATKAA
ncbi:serine/threonine-protein kinase TNNI3K-like [Achlya hypogyna]|uniref:Serine/threonine-protein kinase TNNI3K-like n=1 Tax=Achlya hypogyna TaxID=1202772 RepID=A0A1V9ZHJ9_ACHHY|nr:serine/threonine-protein kinase TNNI3K-like [Achlya hypogyna]